MMCVDEGKLVQCVSGQWGVRGVGHNSSTSRGSLFESFLFHGDSRILKLLFRTGHNARCSTAGKPDNCKQYNDLLSSSRREDILATRDLIVAAPKLVTPMTLMVLAIRLYDVGLRDDAVFWFYAAKDQIGRAHV